MTRKTPPYENAAVTAYWLEHYATGHCTLCGNTGVVDTSTTAVDAGGASVGRKNFCICPNGQAMRAVGYVPAGIVNIGRRRKP